MLVTPHAVVGATIAVLVPSPIIALPLALGSHFVLDKVPHWQETLYPYKPHKGTWTRIPIDIGLAIFLVLYIVHLHPHNFGIIYLSAIAGAVPDVDSIVSVKPTVLDFSSKLKAFKKWHLKIQNETSSLFGTLPQLVVILLCLLIDVVR